MKTDFTNEYMSIQTDPDIIAIEISKSIGKTKQEAIKAGDFNEWTKERIKSAFNFGNGTMKDFSEYADNNKKYCWIDII